MTWSTLKKKATRLWRYYTFPVIVWIFFVSNISSVLDYPWNVLNTLLGILSPFFWGKTVKIAYESKHGRVGEAANTPTSLMRMAISGSIYVALGAASWGSFISFIPPHPVYHNLVLRGIAGSLSPFLWTVAAYLNVDNRLFWNYSIRSHAPGYECKPQPTNLRNRIGWAFFISASAAWIVFVFLVPCDLRGIWFIFHPILGAPSPHFLLCAQYLSIKCEHESKECYWSVRRSNES